MADLDWAIDLHWFQWDPPRGMLDDCLIDIHGLDAAVEARDSAVAGEQEGGEAEAVGAEEAGVGVGEALR